MEFMLPDLAPALPEMVLLAMACVVLLVDLFWPGRERSNTYVVSQLSLLATLLAVAQGYHGPITTFSGHYTVDAVAVVIKVMALLIMFGVFLYGRDYLRQRALLTGEFLLLSLFATLGLLVMASAGSLLVLYLGLEVLSLSSYALVALHRDNGDASEAAIKYFFLGALASGLLLYGMSLLYGLTASLDLATVAQVVGEHARAGNFSALMGLALAMLVVGIGFKLGIAPFHMWLPDVYHGAPTAVTAFLTTISKLAAFVLVVKLLAGAAAPLAQQWQQMLVLVTVLSLAVGNLIAIAQVNLKRMLAYSTISHMGFFLLGVLANSPVGMAASLFYMITYALTGLAAFGMIMLLSRAGFEADRYRGFPRPQPALAVAGAGDDGDPVLAGGGAAHGRLLRQARRHPRGDAARPAVAGDHRGDLLGHRCVLLPARHQGHVLRCARGAAGHLPGPRRARVHGCQRRAGAGSWRVPGTAAGAVPGGFLGRSDSWGLP